MQLPPVECLWPQIQGADTLVAYSRTKVALLKGVNHTNPFPLEFYEFCVLRRSVSMVHTGVAYSCVYLEPGVDRPSPHEMDVQN